MQPWESAFETRTDLKKYKENALGLFALALKFGIEDLDSVAAESITEGNDDKKCDLLYISKEDKIAVAAQCYKAQNPNKKSAPSNKASDLNTAMSWLLSRDLQSLPKKLYSSAEGLRDGIKDGSITTLHIWYIHNLPESTNVKNELQTVEETARSALSNNFNQKQISVLSLEVGKSAFNEWYTNSQSSILVDNDIKVPIQEGSEINGVNWKAYVTAIPARFLYKLYKKHKTALFSANVRDYLGSRSSESNINNGIKNTVEQSPENFWVFNNGLTILVNAYDPIAKGREWFLNIKGMSIVNGAQTTGAIGSLKRRPPENAFVPARFVQTSNSDIVHNIIQFNNSQNKITASDFRSTDPIQKKLKEQISKIPQAEYEGGRRGGHSDAIKRRPNLLPSYTVGQALAAFHGDTVTAYNHKARIWIEDSTYAKYFNDQTKGAHVICAYSLLRAVEERKVQLVTKSKRDSGLTSSENLELDFFRNRGSIFLLVSALASCLEGFLEKKITSKFKISFGDKISPKKAQEIWAKIVNTNAGLYNQLEPAFSEGLKSQDRINKAIQTFQGLVQVTANANKTIYEEFASHVTPHL